MIEVHMVYGPPGTGKTTEMLRRLEQAVKAGVPRSEIGFFSFTRAAADEALQRLGLHRSDKVSTLHALVYRLLHISREQVVDFEKLQELSQKTGIPISGATADSERELLLGDEFLAFIGVAAARRVDPAVVYNASHRPGSPKSFEYFKASYRLWKDANGFVDFNDMLLRFLERAPEFRARVVFIDEAQDLSPLQWQVVERLAQGVEAMHIGGDDDQAIYEWSGADPHGMADFEGRYNAERRVLAQSWRLSRRIHDLGDRVVRRIRRRVDKDFRPRDVDGTVARHGSIFSAQLAEGKTVLVLYRNHSQRRELEEWLMSGRVPFHSMTGKPGPLQSRWATAIRTLTQLQQGSEDVDKRAYDALKRCLLPRFGGSVVAAVSSKLPAANCIQLPWYLVDYFNHVDPFREVQVRLGSIHSAKGREADQVILSTAMGKRTIESWVQNPDAEARVWYVGVTRAKERLDVVEGVGGYPL